MGRFGGVDVWVRSRHHASVSPRGVPQSGVSSSFSLNVHLSVRIEVSSVRPVDRLHRHASLLGWREACWRNKVEEVVSHLQPCCHRIENVAGAELHSFASLSARRTWMVTRAQHAAVSVRLNAGDWEVMPGSWDPKRQVRSPLH